MLKEFSKVFKDKRVFVTGHTGFKGSWLISVLHILGANIKGYALEPIRKYDIFNFINKEAICESEICDIRDAAALKKSILSFQPDFIFHLAAQPLVRTSYVNPTDTFSINVMGTTYLLDTLRELKKECITVIITTDKVYDNKERNYYYKEVDRLGGHDPYSASKAAAELIVDSYRKSFFSPHLFNEHKKSISVARAGNVIGGGDWSQDRIVPDIVRSLHKKEPILVRNPKAVRPWQHVLEPIVGYLLLATKQIENPITNSTAFNFGPNPTDNLTVDQLVNEAILIWGEGTYYTTNQDAAPHEASLLQLDISKAINVLNWKPYFTAKEAIAESIKWYKQYYENQSIIKAKTFSQIREFLER